MVHEEKKLTLVFEYCDLDLKKYLDEHGGQIPMKTIKVRLEPQLRRLWTLGKAPWAAASRSILSRGCWDGPPVAFGVP